MAQEIETVVTEENVEIGTIKIAEEVVAMIAAYATLEVEGIASISGNITADNVSEATFRKLSKGVKVAVWTVNDAASAWAAFGRGVDYVYTDRPTSLMEETKCFK